MSTSASSSSSSSSSAAESATKPAATRPRYAQAFYTEWDAALVAARKKGDKIPKKADAFAIFVRYDVPEDEHAALYARMTAPNAIHQRIARLRKHAADNGDDNETASVLGVKRRAAGPEASLPSLPSKKLSLKLARKQVDRDLSAIDAAQAWCSRAAALRAQYTRAMQRVVIEEESSSAALRHARENHALHLKHLQCLESLVEADSVVADAVKDKKKSKKGDTDEKAEKKDKLEKVTLTLDAVNSDTRFSQRRIYRTTNGGSPPSLFLIATISTATSYNDTGAADGSACR